MAALPRFLDWHKTSLLRSTFLALASMTVSFPLAGFPEIHANPWLCLPLLAACAGTWETARCLQRRWSFYHGAVLLLIYCDLMAVLMIAFLLVAPYVGVSF